MPSEKKRLTFAPYALIETDEEKRASATAFAELRNALKVSDTKPEAPEQPGSWERTAQLHLFFSRGEVRHQEVVGINRMNGEEAKVTVIVLNPEGYTAVLSTETVALLQSIWTEHVKKNGTRARALQIYLTNEWLKTGITDADTESAVASGLVVVP
jgi:hypothetical protein